MNSRAKLPVAVDSVDELRDVLDHARKLVKRMQNDRDQRGEGPSEEVRELRQRVAGLEQDGRALAEQLVVTERRLGRLMNLYVATYQLHSTLDLENVLASIAEIASDLLGAESYVVLIKDDDSERYEIALSEAVAPDSPFAGTHYTSGDQAVDATLADGVLRLGAFEGYGPVATVPLTVQERTVGALVVFKLFSHKAQLERSDCDLLDLLAAHAASALFVAVTTSPRTASSRLSKDSSLWCAGQ